jgi:hypothetical protein
MAKTSAFNTQLKRGICQVDTVEVVGTITAPGDAHFIMTKAAMGGSPITVDVPVLLNDTANIVATKATAAMLLNATIAGLVDITCSGSYIRCRIKIAAADDATFNVAYIDDTCVGLAADANSTNTTAGVAPTAIAYVTNLGGPGLSLDNQDVTTHDQATAFEEVVATLLHSGEVKVDIVYDPNAATHSAAANGLVDTVENKTLAYWQLIFPGPYTWSFQGYATNFEPSAPEDGALTASVTVKITGAPTLV